MAHLLCELNALLRQSSSIDTYLSFRIVVPMYRPYVARQGSRVQHPVLSPQVVQQQQSTTLFTERRTRSLLSHFRRGAKKMGRRDGRQRKALTRSTYRRTGSHCRCRCQFSISAPMHQPDFLDTNIATFHFQGLFKKKTSVPFGGSPTKQSKNKTKQNKK